MAKSTWKAATPAIIERTVIPVRRKNAELRTREYPFQGYLDEDV